MSISLKRARAIFVKDYKEFSRNYAISFSLIVPILFAFLFRSAGPSLRMPVWISQFYNWYKHTTAAKAMAAFLHSF